MKSLLTLKDELDNAREQYNLCQYIDNYNQMRHQQDYWSGRIETIKAQIAEIENE